MALWSNPVYMKPYYTVSIIELMPFVDLYLYF